MKPEDTVIISESDSAALTSLRQRGRALIEHLGLETAKYEDLKDFIRGQIKDVDEAASSLITNLGKTLEISEDWEFNYNGMCFCQPEDKSPVNG